jgi:hypothetical protein
MPDAAADQVQPAPDASPDDAEASSAVLPKIEHAIGPLRQAILDHLLDSVDAGPQSVAQILAAMPPGTTRSNAEAAIHREYKAGRIDRVSSGHYVLAPPKQPEPPDPPPPAAVKMVAMATGFAWPSDPQALAGMTEAQWFEALEKWHADPASWQPLGPPPDDPANKVPYDIMRRWQDRVRKREERRAEAEAAAARQAAADRDLRDQLLAACHGNFVRGPALDDVAPIRAALETVPLDVVLSAIRSKTDRKIYPHNEPATSWHEPRLLKAIAEQFCRFTLAPAMVATWVRVGNAPGKPADASYASPAARMPGARKNALAEPIHSKLSMIAAGAATSAKQ